jgi:hypothetical protein
MANIAVAVAGAIHIVGIPVEQHTAPASEAILAGAPVRFDADGKFTNGNGTSVAEANVYGIATKSVAAGEPVTAVRHGVLDGYTFTQAYGAAIYVSDTDGRLGDTAGTVSVKAGRVISGWSQSLGVAADKLLHVDFNN